MLNRIKKYLKRRNEFTPFGMIYEDELKDIELFMDVIRKVDCNSSIYINGNEIKAYQVTVHKNDKNLLVAIMRDGLYNIRRR